MQVDKVYKPQQKAAIIQALLPTSLQFIQALLPTRLQLSRHYCLPVCNYPGIIAYQSAIIQALLPTSLQLSRHYCLPGCNYPGIIAYQSAIIQALLPTSLQLSRHYCLPVLFTVIAVQCRKPVCITADNQNNRWTYILHISKPSAQWQSMVWQ